MTWTIDNNMEFFFPNSIPPLCFNLFSFLIEMYKVTNRTKNKEVNTLKIKFIYFKNKSLQFSDLYCINAIYSGVCQTRLL